MEAANQLASSSLEICTGASQRMLGKARMCLWGTRPTVQLGDAQHHPTFWGGRGAQRPHSWNTRNHWGQPSEQLREGASCQQPGARACVRLNQPVYTALDPQGRISKVHWSGLQRERLANLANSWGYQADSGEKTLILASWGLLWISTLFQASMYTS